MEIIELEAQEAATPSPLERLEAIQDVAVQDAPLSAAAVAGIAVTDTTDEPAVANTALSEPTVEEVGALMGVRLSEEEKAVVRQRAASIDLGDSDIVLTYGAEAQKAIAEFSDAALQKVKTKDLGAVSDMITDLTVELRDSSEPEKKGLLGLFKKGEQGIAKMKAEYTAVERNVDTIAEHLQGYQNQLGKDVVMLDRMYESNLEYYKELTLTIMAGKERLAAERAGKLAELKARAAQTGLAEDAQAANDYANLLERFEKKIYDLEVTRAICVQMAPQIRLVQNSDVLMVEKIQTTLTNTIPLWKNQMVLALGTEHMRQAVEAQRQVTDVTNELLRKNAEILQQGTIAVAQENERSIVDIETVQETNRRLIETFDEVIRIQAEGRAKRAEAEQTLAQIEAELKDKLLEIKD